MAGGNCGGLGGTLTDSNGQGTASLLQLQMDVGHPPAAAVPAQAVQVAERALSSVGLDVMLDLMQPTGCLVQG